MVHILVTGIRDYMNPFRISYPSYLDMGYYRINSNSISQSLAPVRIICIHVTKLYKYTIPNPYVIPNLNTIHKPNAVLNTYSLPYTNLNAIPNPNATPNHNAIPYPKPQT